LQGIFFGQLYLQLFGLSWFWFGGLLPT
jgi:hypothetical protein